MVFFPKPIILACVCVYNIETLYIISVFFETIKIVRNKGKLNKLIDQRRLRRYNDQMKYGIIELSQRRIFTFKLWSNAYCRIFFKS